jgi:ABC-type Fe3+/spermidine/putrescine transport system ATPase subunit
LQEATVSDPPTPGATETLLQLRGLRKEFDGFVAIRGVDLDVREGEFITLLGPSGCGKTTLLRMIAGFERPSAGEILLDGEDIARNPPELRPFNMVFQSYALFPHMTVFDNVAYGLRTAKITEDGVRRRVLASLEMVGLVDRAAMNVRSLSGGQQQRVALVRAIVNEPRVLLLDEPLGALDLKLRKRMQEELRAIQRRINTTFIYVTHDQEEALVMSHRIVLIRDGQLVQVGAPEDVYHRPQTRFVAEFVGEANMLPCTVVSTEDGGVRVKLEQTGHESLFPHYGSEGLEAGAPGLLAVRPEHMHLAPPDGADMVGRLAGNILLGPVTVHEVMVSEDLTLRVHARPEDEQRVGDQVGVAVQSGRGAVVHREESAIEPEA